MKRATVNMLAVLFLIATTFVWGEAGKSVDLEEEVVILRERVERLEALVEQLLAGEGPASRTAASANGAQVASGTHAPESKAPLPSHPEEDSRPGALRAYWRNGLRLDSADEAFEFQLGGRLMNDWAFIQGDSSLESELFPSLLQDGVEFRRARIATHATIYDRVEFKTEFDFADGDARFTDVYVGLLDLPVLGSLKIGHQKEPYGLEEITSSKYITFLERSIANTFTPARNTGLVVQNDAADQRLNWALGVFRDTGSTGDVSGEGGYNFTGRLTGLPWYEDSGRKLVHLGVAYSRQNSPSPLVRYRSRPEVHLAPNFVDTGLFLADSQDLLGLEGALVNGPFSLQGEYSRASVNSRDGSDPSFWGGYVLASFFLTGENRRYRPGRASFDRVSPRQNFLSKEGGRGAWELAARYSVLDLDDEAIQGGRLKDFTFGVNWYLNPNTRFMWNYVRADREDIGSANILQTRFQLDF